MISSSSYCTEFKETWKIYHTKDDLVYMITLCFTGLYFHTRPRLGWVIRQKSPGIARMEFILQNGFFCDTLPTQRRRSVIKYRGHGQSGQAIKLF